MTYNVFGGTLNLAQPNPVLARTPWQRAPNGSQSLEKILLVVCLRMLFFTQNQRIITEFSSQMSHCVRGLAAWLWKWKSARPYTNPRGFGRTLRRFLKTFLRVVGLRRRGEYS